MLVVVGTMRAHGGAKLVGMWGMWRLEKGEASSKVWKVGLGMKLCLGHRWGFNQQLFGKVFLQVMTSSVAGWEEEVSKCFLAFRGLSVVIFCMDSVFRCHGKLGFGKQTGI